MSIKYNLNYKSVLWLFQETRIRVITRSKVWGLQRDRFEIARITNAPSPHRKYLLQYILPYEEFPTKPYINVQVKGYQRTPVIGGFVR